MRLAQLKVKQKTKEALVAPKEIARGVAAMVSSHSDPMADASVCGAKAKNGSICEALSMANGRCRLHGGLSPGAPKGNRNAWKHGAYSREFKAIRQLERSARR